MRKFLKDLKIFFFIFLVLTLLLGVGLKALTSYANAQKFPTLSVDKDRWKQVRELKIEVRRGRIKKDEDGNKVKNCGDDEEERPIGKDEFICFKKGHSLKNQAVTPEKICTVGEKVGSDEENEKICKGIKVSKFSKVFDKREDSDKGEGRKGRAAMEGDFLIWREAEGIFISKGIKGVNYQGQWNISDKKMNGLLKIKDDPIIKPESGDYWVVTVEGVPDPNIKSCRYNEDEETEECDDDTIWRKGDWLIWNGSKWQKISYTGKIESFFGRGGEIKSEAGDYTWDQINKAVSKVSDISDVSNTDSEDEFILIYSKQDDDSLEWTPKKKKITTGMILEKAVTTLKIKDDSINSNLSGIESSLKDGSVNTSGLAKETVSSRELDDEAVVTKSLKDKEIKNNHLNDKAVTNQKMENLVVVASKIKNGSINKDKIKSNSIYTKHIINGVVTESKVQNNSVGKEQIKNASISSDDLEDNLMTNGNIPDNSIDSSKIKGGTLRNEDFSPGLSLKRSKLKPGSSGSIIYNDDSTGKLSEEKSVAIKRGGTGTNNTQDARNLLGIRPGFNTQKYHARLKDVVDMSINSESVFLGAKDFKLGMLTREEVRKSLDVSDVENLNVDGVGNVGVNIKNPSKKLDVNGSAKVRKDLNMDNKRISNLDTESNNVGSVKDSNCAKLYKDTSFSGEVWNMCPGRAIPIGWKKNISSLKVPLEGVLKLCADELGTKDCATYSNDESNIGDELNDKVSFFEYEFQGAKINSLYVQELANKKVVTDLLKDKAYQYKTVKIFMYHTNPIQSLSFSHTDTKGLSQCSNNDVQFMRRSCGERCPGCFFDGRTLTSAPGKVDGSNRSSVSCKKPKCQTPLENTTGITKVSFMILKSGAGECLTLAGSRSGFRDLKSASCNNSKEQRWFESTRSGKRFFHNEVKGGTWCLDAEGGQGNGARLILYPCHYGNNQQFSTSSAGGNYVYLRPGNAKSTCVYADSSKKIRLSTNCSGSAKKWDKSTQVEYFGSCNNYGSSNSASTSNQMKAGRCSQITGLNNGSVYNNGNFRNGGAVITNNPGSGVVPQSAANGGFILRNDKKSLYFFKVTGTCHNVKNLPDRRTCKVQLVKDGSEILGTAIVRESSQFQIEGYFEKLRGGSPSNIKLKNKSGSIRHFSDVQYLFVKYTR